MTLKTALFIIALAYGSLLSVSAQKKMYNAFTVYSGIELYPKADLNFLAHYNVLIKKPTYA